MKFILQLVLFVLALLLTFLWVALLIAFYLDSQPQGLLGVIPLNNYTEDESFMLFAGLVFLPTMFSLAYFLLWKTNFFSKNK